MDGLDGSRTRNFSATPRRICAAVLLLWLLLGGAAAGAQAGPEYKAERQRALELCEKNDYEDALPILQKLAVADPSDIVVQERLGVALLGHASSLTNAEERKQVRAQAYQALLRAKQLGDNSNLLQILLEQLPPDGSETPFSDRKEVDAAMQEGEAAFAHGDYDHAISAYMRAFMLDPNLYDAALFTGDMYFRKREADKAGQWFARAVQIDPDRETAYRYWGDALMAAGRMAEARDKFIAAVVAEPYSRASWIGLQQWADRNRAELWHPRIQSPNQMKEEQGKTRITIDPGSLDKKDGSSAWLLYEMDRTLWKNEKFAKEFPAEKRYRHSLREEAEALGMVASSVEQQVKDKKVEKLDPALATLLELKQKGLLEAYILIGRADEGIARDLPEYRKANREKLERYVAEYVIHPKAN